MGINIDLNKYDYGKLVNKLMEDTKINNKETLESILIAFGEKCGNTYYLLNNELWEEYNSYYECSSFIDSYFHTDSFDAFLDLGEDANCNRNKWDIARELGIELSEEEEEE